MFVEKSVYYVWALRMPVRAAGNLVPRQITYLHVFCKRCIRRLHFLLLRLRKTPKNVVSSQMHLWKYGDHDGGAGYGNRGKSVATATGVGLLGIALESVGTDLSALLHSVVLPDDTHFGIW